MSYIDDREQFFTPSNQITPGDFETITGYTRHRRDEDAAMPHGMTAQYLNEVVDKRNGMEVVDKDGDIWGWVYDCHKGVGKWIVSDTHDRRVKQMAYGRGQPALLPDYEPYYYTAPETTGEHTDHAHIPVNDPVNPNHYQGFSNGAEVIDITENLTFSAGNAVKYLSRAGRIDGQNKGSILEDLRKAAWYVAREIDRIEAQK